MDFKSIAPKDGIANPDRQDLCQSYFDSRTKSNLFHHTLMGLIILQILTCEGFGQAKVMLSLLPNINMLNMIFPRFPFIDFKLVQAFD